MGAFPRMIFNATSHSPFNCSLDDLRKILRRLAGVLLANCLIKASVISSRTMVDVAVTDAVLLSFLVFIRVSCSYAQTRVTHRHVDTTHADESSLQRTYNAQRLLTQVS